MALTFVPDSERRLPHLATTSSPGLLLSRLAVAAAFLVVALVAAGFRLYRLTDLPPGLHHDEAVNGLDALVTIPSQHPIFFEANNGREPLFIYLQWLSVTLFGPTVWSLRFAAAVVGILTVLAVFWLGRSWFGARVGFLASFGLAASFWHVDLSRVGLRSISVSLFLVLCLLFLGRGLRRGSLVSYALAGLALGLDLYTYTSARLVPLLVLAIFVFELLRTRRDVRRRLLGFALLVLVSAAVVAPLGLYFLHHPDSLIHRADEVWIFNPNPQIEGQKTTFAVNVEHTLGMFFVRGDLNPRQNLPGRPVFDLWTAPWFVLGLAIACGAAVVGLVSPLAALKGGRKDERLKPGAAGDASRDFSPRGPSPAFQGGEGENEGGEGRNQRGEGGIEPAVWLVPWLVGFLALGALTYESPDFLRLSGLAPAAYLTFGLGLGTAWTGLEGIVVRRGRRLAGPAAIGLGVVVAGLLAFEAGQTYRDYFQVWAKRGDVYEGFDAGLSAAARFAQTWK